MWVTFKIPKRRREASRTQKVKRDVCDWDHNNIKRAESQRFPTKLLIISFHFSSHDSCVYKIHVSRILRVWHSYPWTGNFRSFFAWFHTIICVLEFSSRHIGFVSALSTYSGTMCTPANHGDCRVCPRLTILNHGSRLESYLLWYSNTVPIECAVVGSSHSYPVVFLRLERFLSVII